MLKAVGSLAGACMCMAGCAQRRTLMCWGLMTSADEQPHLQPAAGHPVQSKRGARPAARALPGALAV